MELNASSLQKEKIHITVHKGQYWENNFILKKNEIFLSSAKKNSLKINKVEVTEESGEKSKLKINL